jgi:predicted DNA-binding transcriptional regulator AlpA
MSKEIFTELKNKKFYRAKEVTEYLGICKSNVWRLSKLKKITPIKISDKVTVFSIDEINKVFNLNDEVSK